MDFGAGDALVLERLLDATNVEGRRLAGLLDGGGQHRLDGALLLDALALLLDHLRDGLLVAEALVVVGQVDVLGVDGLPVHIQFQLCLFAGLALVDGKPRHNGALCPAHIHQQTLEQSPLLAVLLPLPHAHPLFIGQAEVLRSRMTGSIRRDGAGDGRPVPLGASAVAVGHQLLGVLGVLAHHRRARGCDGR